MQLPGPLAVDSSVGPSPITVSPEFALNDGIKWGRACPPAVLGGIGSEDVRQECRREVSDRKGTKNRDLGQLLDHDRGQHCDDVITRGDGADERKDR